MNDTLHREAALISVVVPAHNEERVLPEFHRRLAAVLDGLDLRSQVIYVNDGSRDGTLAVLRSLHAQDPRVAVIDLSRNFGKEAAMTAGLDHAGGDAVVVIDADLQDPPELIPALIARWREGPDVVYATRIQRRGESWLKRWTAASFYRVIRRVSRVRIPADTGDFRLMSRRAVDALLLLREHHRFMKGLFTWVGFEQVSVPYEQASRAAGTTKFNYVRLWNFALTGITSFTTLPLKVATYLGLATAFIAFLYGAIVIIKTLVYGDSVAGYPSMMTVILLLGGAQLTSLGIVGEYLARMFDEVKRRPLYLTQELLEPREEASARLSLPPHHGLARQPRRAPDES